LRERKLLRQSNSIVDLLHQLSSVQQELKAANRELIDALGRAESTERMADLEQQVALLNEISDSIAERVRTMAEEQARDGRTDESAK
jgi:DNA-binding FrmR family transcriptional regulator